ncbi:MAG: SCO family protein [Betaproteobacteria bacterium]|nr:SCO family protein [Betaproteobacteria bacterium]
MRRRQIFALSLMPALLSACKQGGPPAFRATDLTGASFGRDFALDDIAGHRRALADFRGKVVILFFGYASCPDVCPTTLSRLAEVMKLLGPKAGQVQVVFVTVDPERDTADRLRDFVPWFHPDFLPLRGTPEETRKLLAEFRATAIKRPVEGSMGYVIDHSAACYVFDPTGRLRLYVRDEQSAADIAADVKLLLGTT